MANQTGNENRKSVKNIYNTNTGLPIMINLNVIRYIYYHIKKAQRFISSDGSGKKPKAETLYQTQSFPMSRQRLHRINNGYPFELTANEAASMIDTYGIDRQYFRKGNPVAFQIKGLSEIEWKCYFKHKYKEYELDVQMEEAYIAENAKVVECALKRLLDGWEKRLKKDDPVYAICYYFHYGIRSDVPSGIMSLKEILKNMDYMDWDEESNESLTEAFSLMQNHCSYINSILTLKRLRSMKN